MNTRKHNTETQYIYIKQEINQCLRMESKKGINMLACAWSEKFCDCLLVCFKLNVKYELIKLGKGGTPDICEITWSMSKTKPSRLPTRNMWAKWSL